MDSKLVDLQQAATVNSTDLIYVVQGPLDKKCSLDTLTRNLPNVFSKGALVISSANNTSGNINANSTVELLNASTGTLPLGQNGEVKVLVNNTTSPVSVLFNGFANKTQIILNGKGSSITLNFVSGSWIILSTFDATVV